MASDNKCPEEAEAPKKHVECNVESHSTTELQELLSLEPSLKDIWLRKVQKSRPECFDPTVSSNPKLSYRLHLQMPVILVWEMIPILTLQTHILRS
jgi:hypothetical protein